MAIPSTRTEMGFTQISEGHTQAYGHLTVFLFPSQVGHGSSRPLADSTRESQGLATRHCDANSSADHLGARRAARMSRRASKPRARRACLPAARWTYLAQVPAGRTDE